MSNPAYSDLQRLYPKVESIEALTVRPARQDDILPQRKRTEPRTSAKGGATARDCQLPS